MGTVFIVRQKQLADGEPGCWYGTFNTAESAQAFADEKTKETGVDHYVSEEDE